MPSEEKKERGTGRTRKSAPGKLRKERDILAAVVETAGALILVLNPEGQIVFFNRACEEATGWTAKEIRGKRVCDHLLLPEEVEPVKAVFEDLRSGNFPNKHENYWVTRDGSRRLIAWNNTALVDGAGQVEYVVATGTDITERREADEALRKRTHEVQERVKELQCMYNIARLRERENATLEGIVQGVADQIPPAWQYPEITCARIVWEGRPFTTKNFRQTRWKQSSEIHVKGEHVGLVEVYYLEKQPELDEGPFLKEERHLVDAIAERLGRIIEHSRSQERLLEYQRQLRHLASELSLIEERERRRIATDLHDRIGQALAVVRMKLGELRDIIPAGKLDDVLRMLETAINSTRSLTFELSPPVLHELGFEAALEWLATRFREEHEIALEVEDDKQPKPLSEDLSVVLFQSVRELLHNAAKHAQAQTVWLKSQRDGDSLRIEVADDGVGFNPKELSVKRFSVRGFGLFSITERLGYLGAKLEISSEPGKGTRVVLLAPLEQETRDEGTIAGVADKAQAGKRIRILLADDQKITREGLRALLEKYADMEVVAEAAGGREAVRLAAETGPDVVVMDVGMPDLNGIEATRQIMSQDTHTKVVALSMHSDGQFVLEMLRAGAAGYLLKDCAQEDLAHAIRTVNAQLTFFSPGIADTVVEDYVRHRGGGKAAASQSLTPREREVLKLLAEGQTTKQIAGGLEVSVKTIEAHRQHIMEKLDLRSVAELTKYAIREGLTALEP